MKFDAADAPVHDTVCLEVRCEGNSAKCLFPKEQVNDSADGIGLAGSVVREIIATLTGA